jgi:hypothetical protein
MLFSRAIQPGIAVPIGLRSRHLTIPHAALAVVGIAALAAIPHAINMWSYPAFSIADDEGIYASQAIAWLHTGALSPYTYSYDHAPGGWIQLAVFYALTGGPATFGTPIDGGRVFMLIMHVGSALLLYRLVRLLGGSMLAGVLAVIVMTVSPLAVFYQRMVLLDNIMVFWLLLALVLAIDGRSRGWLAWSGVAFAIALLSKEFAALFAPVMLVLAWRRDGGRGLLTWAGAAALTVLPYPAYALSRGELLPVTDPYLPYVVANDAAARPSLISTLIWQLTRPGGGTFSLTNNFVWYLRNDWLWRDPTLLVLGVASIGWNGLRRRPRVGLAAVIGLIPCLYLARGGITFGFYIIFALPFLALNVALSLDPLLARSGPRRRLRLAGSLLVLLMGSYWWSGALQPLYTEHPDTPIRDVEAWIKTYIPLTATIVGRDDLLADLREPIGGPAFSGFQVHWQVVNDPAVGSELGYDWSRIDYIILDPHELADFAGTGNTLALAALDHAHKVAEWTFVNPDAAPLHWDQHIEIWEADRLADPNLAAFRAALLHGRDQLCMPRVSSCDDVGDRTRGLYGDTAAAPAAIER